MDPLIGQIMMFAGNFAPRGWALCDGQLLPISSNQALFAILGTMYGGDGRTTFGLPDLRGRVPVHAGEGSGLTKRRPGEKGGEEKHTLIEAEIPQHDHPPGSAQELNIPCHNGPANTPNATDQHTLANAAGNAYTTDAPNAHLKPGGSISGATGKTGGGKAHNNMQPYQCVNYIIALVGVFPSRN